MDDLNHLSLEDLYHRLERTGLIRRLVELARDEDLGSVGDLTSLACISEKSIGKARIVARRPGVIAGLAAMPTVLSVFAPDARFDALAHDGRAVEAGETVGMLAGPVRQLLVVERPALNLLGRLCGIASRTRRFVDAIGPHARAQVFDTRKTTPGLRVLEKYAVRCGGGMCHRLGLHDAVLIKDNHLAGIADSTLAGSIAEAVRRARALDHRISFIEVEVDTPAQLEQILSLERGVIDMVLLDNMSPQTLRRAVALRDRLNPGVVLEASGGVTLETIGAIASTGVERISVGSLTHAATWLDLAVDRETERAP